MTLALHLIAKEGIKNKQTKKQQQQKITKTFDKSLAFEVLKFLSHCA